MPSVPRSGRIVSKVEFTWEFHGPLNTVNLNVHSGSLCSILRFRSLLLSMSDSPRDANLEIATHPHEESVAPVPEQRKAGASWKDKEQQVLPENRLWIVFSGLMCCIFLAALDQVRFPLITQAPPTYSSVFSMQSDNRCYCFTDHRRAYWRREKLQLGRQVRHLFPRMDHSRSSPTSSYLLAASALAPLYGKLSDLIGRKPILYFAIFTFLVCVQSDIICAFPYSMISIVGLGTLWRCAKPDLANYLPGRPRNRRRRPHPACSNYHIRHSFFTRVCLVLSSPHSSLANIDVHTSRGKYGGFVGATWGVAR